MKLKALLLKDVYVLRKQGFALLVITVAFAAIPYSYLNIMAILYAAIIPQSVISDDERTRWGRMAAMMPYTPTELVLGRYVLGWGWSAVSLLVAELAGRLMGAFFPRATNFPLLTASFFLALCLIAVSVPLIVRFGAAKARLINAIVLGCVCGGASFLGSTTVLPVGGVSSDVWFGPMAAALVLTPLSIPLALRWYRQQDR